MGKIWFAIIVHGWAACKDGVRESRSGFLLWDAASVLCARNLDVHVQHRFHRSPRTSTGCAHWASMIAVSFKCRCQILRRVNKGTISAVFNLHSTFPALHLVVPAMCLRARYCLVICVFDQDLRRTMRCREGSSDLMQDSERWSSSARLWFEMHSH